MATFFKLSVLTPERSFYEGLVESIIVTTQTGQMGIMANATPTATGIVPGFTKIKDDLGQWKEAMIADGFMQVRPDEVVVMSQYAYWPDEVFEEEVIHESNKEQEIMRQANSLKEYELSKAAMMRAFALLQNKRNIK